MRLTLRTMLAYLEGVLDATDAEQLGHKIEESEFAASLMHRTRDVTRRLKLGAPKIDGRGLAADPNTVSEYLDNTLPAERVPEFEKICLESDVHLAEVASVHQILVLVLGEQAEFDPAMRGRMYKLIDEADHIESEAAAKETKQPVAVAVQPQPAKPRRRPEIPDYLRDSKEPRNYVPWVLAAAILVCLGAGGYLFVNQGGMDLLVAQNNPEQQEAPPAIDGDNASEPRPPVAAVPAGRAPEDGAAPDSSSSVNPTDVASKPGAGAQREAGSSNAAPPVDPDMPEEGAAPLDDGKLAQDGAASGDAPPAGQPAPKGSAAAPMPPTPGSLMKNIDDAFNPEPPAAKEPAGFEPAPAPAPMKDPAPQPGAPAREDAAEATGTDTAPAKRELPRAPTSVLDDDALAPGGGATAQPAAGATGPVVGRLTNDSEVLLRPAGADRAWTRLSTRDALAGGNELISLPSFRPSISLNTPGGATAQLLGGTVARLLPPNTNGVPGLHVIDGQVVLLTAGKPGTQLQLQVGDKVYLITFVDPDSTLAVEVRRSIPEGGDPIRDPARTTAELFVAGGVVDVGPLSGGKHEALTVPDRKTLMGVAAQDPAAGATGATLPAWIVGTTPNQNDKRATLETEKLLTAGESVRQPLEELSHDRRVEFRNLAVQSLITMGDFEAFLPALDDPMQKANWNAQIDAVRRAMARNHQTAKALKATFEAQRDQKQAEDLYKLLCGVSRQELLAGADRWLVNELDNDAMDYRVLAFWNLRQFSVGTLDYHPEHNTAKKRAVGVRAWKLRSDQRQIVPKS